MNDVEGALIVGGGLLLGYALYEAVKAVGSITDPFGPTGVIGPIVPPAPKPGGAAPHNPYGKEWWHHKEYHAVKNKQGKWVWALGPPPGQKKPPHKAPKKVQKTPPHPAAHPKPAKPPKHKEPVRAKPPGKLVAL